MSLADVLTPTLSRLQARYEQTPLPRFLGWWLGELRGLLPARWRNRLAVQETEVWLATEGDELQVCLVAGGRSSELARVPLSPASELPAAVSAALGERSAGLRRILLLAPEQTLRRRMSLPLVARDQLRTMLGFELDRQTPFRAEQVYFDIRVLPHPADVRQLPVELVLVQRDSMEQVLAALGPLTDTLDAVDVRDDGHRLGCNLLPAERRRRRSSRGLLINLGLIGASLLLVLLAMAAIVENRRDAVAELEQTIDERRRAARGVNELRASLDQAVAAANFLAVQKTEQPSMLELLAELSEILPDHTYLERMHVSGDTVTMTGLSSQAAALIEALQQARMLRNPAISGAINPDPRSGKDRFSLSAELRPAAEVAQ